MNDQTCNCGKPTRNDAYTCDDCLSKLARALGEVPWLLDQLEVSMTKIRGVDYTAMGESKSDQNYAKRDVDDDGDKKADAATRLPYNDRASDAARNLRHVLTTWARFCEEDGVRHQSPMDGLPEPDDGDQVSTQALSRWLLWRVDGLGLVDLGSEVVSDVTRAVGRCRGAIDGPVDKVYGGPCDCGRDLYGKVNAAIFVCQGCGRDFPVEQRHAEMWAEAFERLFTATEASTLLGLYGSPTPRNTIVKWHERGRVLAHGTDEANHPLYRLDELAALANHKRPA